MEWLKRSFHKLLLNFTWWVNRKDRSGNNVFEGGFLGLDNIGVFDRSAPLPTGGYLEQADGTAWMALFCQNMLEIAVELAMTDPHYAGHGAQVRRAFPVDRVGARPTSAKAPACGTRRTASSTTCCGCPTAQAHRLKVRSMVGLLPLVRDHRVRWEAPGEGPRDRRAATASSSRRARNCGPTSTTRSSPAADGRLLGSILDETKLRRVLAKMLDENEFLSPYGIRSLSRYHADHPFVFHVGGQEYRVSYLPAESDTGMFGGNSNWRGPIWMPVNALIVRALLQYYTYYGDDFTVECPTGSGRQMTLYQVAEEITRRLATIFLRDENGRRPVYGGIAQVPGRSALARLPAVLRVLSRRQRRRSGRKPPDRLDGRRRATDASASRPARPSRFSSSERWRR